MTTTGTVPGKSIPYSDHEAVLVTLSVQKTGSGKALNHPTVGKCPGFFDLAQEEWRNLDSVLDYMSLGGCFLLVSLTKYILLQGLFFTLLAFSERKVGTWLLPITVQGNLDFRGSDRSYVLPPQLLRMWVGLGGVVSVLFD